MGLTTQEKLTVIAENEQRVFDAGKEQGVKEWMYKYQTLPNGKPTTDYIFAFAGTGWTDELYRPQREMLNLTRTTNMFSYSEITDTKVPIGILEGHTKNVSSTFQNGTMLKKIVSYRVHPQMSMSSAFENCGNLVYLRIEGTIGRAVNLRWSPLDKDSIEDVFDHLGTPTTTQTLTFKGAAVDAAFEGGRTSDEWLALVAEAEEKNWSVGLYDE